MTEDELVSILQENLYRIADAMMAHYDCCHIEGSACKAYPDGNTLCCHNGMFGKGLCPFWVDNACQNPNVDCRLWLCRTALETTDQKCKDGLYLLQQFAKLYGIVRPPLNGHPYSGADRQPK